MKVINESKVQEVLEYIKSFQLKEVRSPSWKQRKINDTNSKIFDFKKEF